MIILILESIIVGLITLLIGHMGFNLTANKNNRDEKIKPMGINVAFFLQPIAGIDEKKYFGWGKKWFQSSQEDIKARRIFYEHARDMTQRLSATYPIASMGYDTAIYRRLRHSLLRENPHAWPNDGKGSYDQFSD